MITKEEYEEAQQIVWDYEDQLKNNGVLDDVSVLFLYEFVNEFTDTEIPIEAIKETLDRLNKR
jgi:predicted metal-dependent hydrolase